MKHLSVKCSRLCSHTAFYSGIMHVPPGRLFDRTLSFLISAMRICLLVLLAGLASLTNATEPPLPESIEFNRDVLPILSDNCYFCHGPDPSHREADLRLDDREAAIASHAFIVAEPDKSALMERVRSNDPELQMPPPESNKKLTERQKQILARWIQQGAEYQRHWSYEPPVKVSTPPGSHPVDALIREKLTSVGLNPAVRADRRTLIRRLYSDLLGLLPSQEEVQGFTDDPAPDAYEQLVERLLASPHYGERMAIAWLDVVRYADTIGYHSDTPRNVWPYRDWVIKSFNENKPFDRFTREQIAGDLLPDANVQTRVGSAFNRLLLTTEEGGAQSKDYESRYLTDRVRAIGAAWLGQTTGCAQCHDHKFDPIKMRDFYALGAFFADIQEPIIGRREDGMAVTTTEEDAKLAALDAALADARQKHAAIVPQWEVAQQQWETDIVDYAVTLPELRDGSTASDGDKNLAKQITEWLKKEPAKRSPQEREQIQAYYRKNVSKIFISERDALAKAERERNDFYNALPKCLVSVRSNSPRVVRILPRGDWMNESGEIIKPALPHYLPQPKIEGRELTRLDLADWLVSRDNPLTARTVMNRLWKQMFGTGLSKVLDDLGAQGEPPVNPELLDYLACDFMDRGWDFKQMVRLIVTSQAYQQVSTPTPEQLALDPYNRYCSRQSAFRVESELVRDYALSVAGLLELQIGGPSVKPYQPDGYWENLNFPVRGYDADKGRSQYRRGLYVWWQRSFLHPSLLAFDAPSREECTAERNRSNIPQQALVLLNDPTYVEAARAFAGRILKESNGSTEDRLAWAWRVSLQRDPRQEEREAVRQMLESHVAHYRAHPEAVEALLKTGLSPVPEGMDKSELAAWTHVARVLLNLHEMITRS